MPKRHATPQSATPADAAPLAIAPAVQALIAADLEEHPWGPIGVCVCHRPSGLACLRVDRATAEANRAAARHDLALILGHFRQDTAKAKAMTYALSPAAVPAATTPRVPTQLAMGVL